MKLILGLFGVVFGMVTVIITGICILDPSLSTFPSSILYVANMLGIILSINSGMIVNSEL